MAIVANIGAGVLRWFSGARATAAVIVAALGAAGKPRFWPRTVRDVLARQVYFTAVEAVRFVAMVALFVGLAVVVQAQVWLTRVGQSALVGPLLVAVIVREVGPLLTNFVVIGRSGTAMASELATMKVNREVRLLDAQGLDPFVYLVMPRVIGMMVSVFCLSVIFIFLSFLSGYLTGVALGVGQTNPLLFARVVLREVTPVDILNVVAKTCVPGLATGAICCIEGLSVEGALTEVPQATGRAVIRSVAAMFVISAVVSVVTYM